MRANDHRHPSGKRPLDAEAQLARPQARESIAETPLCQASSQDGSLHATAKSGGPGALHGKGHAPKQSRARDADGTQARILAAATKEFAENGYSGARIDAICRAARANPRMIYHYFTDKDGLYVAVLERVLGELRSEELKLAVDQVPPMQGVLELFSFIHGHFGQHPELINLLSGENLLKARFLKRSTKTPIIASPLIDLLRELLLRGERERAIRPGVDPLRLYVKMVALSYFHRSNAYTLSSIFRSDVRAADWQAEYREESELMLELYLRAQPEPERLAKRAGKSR
jgi:AcrR family transcriptional regulator